MVRRTSRSGKTRDCAARAREIVIRVASSAQGDYAPARTVSTIPPPPSPALEAPSFPAPDAALRPADASVPAALFTYIENESNEGARIQALLAAGATRSFL